MGACHHNETIPFFYNSSGKELSRYWRTKDVLVVTLGLLVCVIVILANTLVIAAVVLNRRFHQPIFYLLANLAATDFFSGVAYTYLMFHTGPRTAQLTVHTWFLRQGLIDTSLTASVTNLLAVAVERHQTVFQMQLHSNMSNQRVTFLIACIWVTAIIMGLIPQMGWNCVCDLSTCSRMAPLYSRSYLVFWAISNLLIFCIMLLVYLRIFYYVKHKVQRMSQHTLQSRHKETMMNLMKTVVIILSAFVLCWTPGLVVLLLDGVDCESCDVLKVEKYFLLLAELNSLFNPLIYSFRDNEMRQTFKQILCLPWRGATSFTTSHTRTHILMHKVPSPGPAHIESQGVNSSV
ncbi:lysophosphatidic acid receptor 2-like isoform X1 [Narcine bancroftii]|uniref:lysophosphatidic acid receptor 2-like isoform X1 n=1 Tax=Narcine bancroftii TaxID=1343680 RepID=UPI0038321657